MNSRWAYLRLAVLGGAVAGVLILAFVADAAPSQPQPRTTTLAALEEQGIYLTLPAQAQNTISRSRAEAVARENGMGSDPANSFLAQLRDQKGVPGPNGPVGFTGPVWVVELDPNTSGLGQPLGGDIRQADENGVMPDRPYQISFSLVFVDARNGESLFTITVSHQ